MRVTRYEIIAQNIRARIERGEFHIGRSLPSEAELSQEHQASRVTIRRALEMLRNDLLVEPRQGFGWVVAGSPVQQSLGHLGTIESQLESQGIISKRRVLDFRFVEAPTHIKNILGISNVLRVRRLNTADEHPFALVTVWCPEEYGSEISRSDASRSPFYELIGIPLGGATQTIGAITVSTHDADLLQIPHDSPVLRCERVTKDIVGKPVLVSEHIFPAHLTEFVVDLPQADVSIAPSGLRFVSS